MNPPPKPLVYVAGPITGDPFGCVRNALPAFNWLRGLGCVPFLPQLSVLAEMIEPRPYDDWLTYDLELIDHCDALVRLPGDSQGADGEVAYAKIMEIPVFLLDATEESDLVAAEGEFAAWVAAR